MSLTQCEVHKSSFGDSPHAAGLRKDALDNSQPRPNCMSRTPSMDAGSVRYVPGITAEESPCSTLPASQDYVAWKAEHPCLLNRFEEFTAAAQGKKLCIFLDYDGTLSPIVKDPDRAYMPDQMREAVAKVAQHLPTAIITGRCLEKVIQFVQLDQLFYAGSHGLDIAGPQDGPCATKMHQCKYQPAAAFTGTMNKVHDELVENVASIPGAAVEHNKFAVSVHFRNCDPNDWEKVEEVVKTVVSKYGEELHMTQGRKVREVRPNLNWDKGKAVLYMLQELGLDNSPDVLPIYIGDDRTDEDAFRALRDRGSGLGILVSNKAKETAAVYTLQDPFEVLRFLQQLGDW
eukprot:CAMPEP_0197849640 /NCGR_PEP_ID=MMETSP1438-20131217/12764_1 /TAXON_ID=1461541 /ORGANISM="Pterosperma sp., Strain CCMP1384" /LENGTH=344 /DNA_ID=CAMNT_0043462419 /DNA_START=355 /DNA_END=1386 /DNA_ORIENTATION=+